MGFLPDVTVATGLNKLCHAGQKIYQINISHLNQIALYYFRLKREKSPESLLKTVSKQLWCATYEMVLPVLNAMHQLPPKLEAGKYWPIRRAIQKLTTQGRQLLQQMHIPTQRDHRFLSMLISNSYAT